MCIFAYSTNIAKKNKIDLRPFWPERVTFILSWKEMVSCFCGVVNNTCKKMCIFSSISIKGWAVNNLELFSKNIRYAGLHLKKSFFQLRKVSASSCFSISIGPRYTYHFVILLRCCFFCFFQVASCFFGGHLFSVMMCYYHFLDGSLPTTWRLPRWKCARNALWISVTRYCK